MGYFFMNKHRLVATAYFVVNILNNGKFINKTMNTTTNLLILSQISSKKNNSMTKKKRRRKSVKPMSFKNSLLRSLTLQRKKYGDNIIKIVTNLEQVYTRIVPNETLFPLSQECNNIIAPYKVIRYGLRTFNQSHLLHNNNY